MAAFDSADFVRRTGGWGKHCLRTRKWSCGSTRFSTECFAGTASLLPGGPNCFAAKVAWQYPGRPEKHFFVSKRSGERKTLVADHRRVGRDGGVGGLGSIYAAGVSRDDEAEWIQSWPQCHKHVSL